jgi:hypothetical protein
VRRSSRNFDYGIAESEMPGDEKINLPMTSRRAYWTLVILAALIGQPRLLVAAMLLRLASVDAGTGADWTQGK